MEAYRKVLTVKDAILQIMLPKTLRNRMVEVIVLPSETIDEEKVEDQIFDFTQYYGKIKSGLSMQEIDEKLKALRGEWDRLPD